MLTVVVDNQTDTLSSVAPGIPQIPEVVGVLGRVAPTGDHEGHPCITAFDHLCVACHGLSVLLTGRIGDETRSMLFDVGPYGDVWVANAARLGVDLATIDTVFLSHWHWDHSGGFPVAIDAISRARAAAGQEAPVVVDLHPDRPDQRGVLAPGSPVGTPMVMLPTEPTVVEIEAAGGRVEHHAEAHLIGDGFFLGSGEIPRLIDYETGLVGHHSVVDGVVRPDPWLMEERFVAAEVAGRGVTVLSACSHAGIVNACTAAMAHYPEAPVDLVLGGFHLAGGPMEARIAPTVEDLATRVRPRILAPGHCTGWRAVGALAERFAPDHLAPSAVGSRFWLRREG